jgi:hypothetical protein
MLEFFFKLSLITWQHGSLVISGIRLKLLWEKRNFSRKPLSKSKAFMEGTAYYSGLCAQRALSDFGGFISSVWTQKFFDAERFY